MSGPFTTLPNAGDLFIVSGPSANYVNTAGITIRCDAEPGVYLCLRSDSVNNVAYGALATGGDPGRTPTGPNGELGIPLAKIRQCFAAR